MTKPAYLLPTMAEVAATPRNGLRSISLFAGAGGSSLGHRMAGYRVLWANEIIPVAAQTYALNKSATTLLDTRDVRTIAPEQILEAICLKKGELDLMDGSPPCSSFSTIGRGASEWGRSHRYGQSANVLRTDDLFFEYIRLLEAIQPRAFVAENVTGMVKGVSRGYFLTVLAMFKECGYRVTARIVDAAWLGVPQSRKRMIFVGVRADLDRDPVFPDPLPYGYSMREVFPYMTRIGTAPALREFTEDPVSAFKPPDQPCPTVVTLVNEGVGLCITAKTGGAGGVADPRDVTVDLETGFDLDYPPRELYRGRARRILAKGGLSAGFRPTPGRVRRYSLAELRAIFSFPPDFVLTGTYADRWERLARSVPPLMMKAVAETVAQKVLT
jgi:DNA (cytosine-5)-methyltransferase 1